jgi:hypothetical protein
MRIFIIYTLHQIILGWQSQRVSDGRGIQHALMGWEISIEIVLVKSMEMRPLEVNRRRCNNNIKMDLWKVG